MSTPSPDREETLMDRTPLFEGGYLLRGEEFTPLFEGVEALLQRLCPGRPEGYAAIYLTSGEPVASYRLDGSESSANPYCGAAYAVLQQSLRAIQAGRTGYVSGDLRRSAPEMMRASDPVYGGSYSEGDTVVVFCGPQEDCMETVAATVFLWYRQLNQRRIDLLARLTEALGARTYSEVMELLELAAPKLGLKTVDQTGRRLLEMAEVERGRTLDQVLRDQGVVMDGDVIVSGQMDGVEVLAQLRFALTRRRVSGEYW